MNDFITRLPLYWVNQMIPISDYFKRLIIIAVLTLMHELNELKLTFQIY
jgi:hypothetical protein